MTPVDIGTVLAIVAVAVIVAIDKLKERKAKKRGLPPNPGRCEDMANRMTAVEDDIVLIRDDIKYMLKRME